MWDLIVSVPDHCLSFYFAIGSSLLFRLDLCVFCGGVLVGWSAGRFESHLIENPEYRFSCDEAHCCLCSLPV